jgi:uncharacterized protein (UPF0264 family)
MSKWLASIQSLEEAQTLVGLLPDILDIKNPSQGALGALSVADVAEIVTFIAGRCETSATVGDLAMQAEVINPAIKAMADSGVDYIKVGLFPAHDLSDCLTAMTATIESLPVPVSAVLFADSWPQQDIFALLKVTGFSGVMVDTAIKDGQHLLDHWESHQLAAFVSGAHQQNLMCGLAGALRQQDVYTLQPFGADYLGFRSALCESLQRTAALNLELVVNIKAAIQQGHTLKKAM